MPTVNLMDEFLDPCIIKANALEDLTARIIGGTPIVDANNVPMFLMEKFSSVIADSMLAAKQNIDVLYKLRAMSPEDLYKHMSNYDFIGVYSTPASFMITILMEKQYIVHNAKSVNDNYLQIVIPENTSFTLGSYQFGIYYPIVIRINKVTNSITAYYDDTKTNPLQTIDENSFNMREVKISGLTFLQIDIPVYQFIKTVTTEAVTPDAGFVKLYNYVDEFYALRVFNYNNTTADWDPLDVTLSETIYDINTPTVHFVVNQDNKQLQISIPPIYFTNGLLKTKMKIEIYTTKGELSVDVASIAATEVSVDFKITTTDIYSSILDKMESLVLAPTLATITGGTNGITLTELRSKVITNSFYKQVLTSPSEIEAYFNDFGFTSSRLECNITDLIFLCHKQLTNSFGNVIGAGFISTFINNDTVTNSSLTIKENIDGSITIMPNAIFKYDEINNICTPLSNSEYTTLNVKNNFNKILDYNSNIYTKQPYHVRLERSNRYPIAYTYDLNQPTATSLMSLGENLDADVQVTIDAIAVTHDGLNGYNIRLMVNFIGNFTTDDVTIYFYTKDVADVKVGAVATFDTDYDTKHIYNIHIDTNYSLFKNNTIYLTSLTTDSNQAGCEIPLTFTGTFVTLIKSTSLETTALNPNIGYQVPSSLKNTYTALSEQSAVLTLGTYMSCFYNNVDVSYKAIEYAKYDQDIYLRAEKDIYKTNPDGTPFYTINPVTNLIEYVKLYSVGEYIKNDVEADEVNNVIDSGVVTSSTNLSLIDTSKSFTNDQYRNYQIHITGGTGEGQWRPIFGNTSQELLINRAWEILPDSTSTYDIVDYIVQHYYGNIILINGQPIITNARDLDYHIHMLHLDAKLDLVTNINYTNIMTYTRQVLLSYMNIVTEASKQVIENTKLFFCPIKTIGVTKSYVGNNILYSHNLELTMKFKLYVQDYVLKDVSIQNNIYNNVLNIIDEYTSTSQDRIIGMDVIVSNIKENLSNYVINVDSLGFFDNTSLQTLKTTSTDTKPHLRQYLVLDEDGVISVARGLTLEYATI